MATNGQPLLDGFSTLESGVDSGLPPQLIGRNQVAMAVNCTFRGGFIGPRPALIKRALLFPDNDQGVTQANFEGGKFQTAGIQGGIDGLYTPTEGTSYLPVAISGRIFLINLADYSVQDVSVAGDLNPPDGDQGYFCQAEQYLLYQDGVAGCFIRNGPTSRRARAGSQEVPVGTRMGYGLGRLAVALAPPRGREYVIGNLVNGGTEVIDFTENTFLNEGGSFSTLFHTGDISGFAYPVNLNTPLGQSLLAVYTPKGVYFNTLPADRTTWKDLTTPLQVVALLNSGSKSPSITNVNSDLWFRSMDGIRSLGISVRNFGDWGDTPMSLEMSFILHSDTPRLLKYSSSALFDNRLITTCTPIQTERGVYHLGLAVLDFFLLGSLKTKQAPCWEGLWTGLQSFAVVEGDYNDESRCFIVALSQAGKIELWELLRDGEATADNDDGVTSTAIQWWFELPKYAFTVPKTYKQLTRAYAWISDMSGPCSFALEYRHDEDPCYHAWFSWTDCATVKQCVPVNGCLPNVPAVPQFRYNVQIPQPGEECDPVAKYPNRCGWLFQPRISVTGFAKFRSFWMAAQPMPDPIPTGCLANTPCQVQTAFSPYRL